MRYWLRMHAFGKPKCAGWIRKLFHSYHLSPFGIKLNQGNYETIFWLTLYKFPMHTPKIKLKLSISLMLRFVERFRQRDGRQSNPYLIEFWVTKLRLDYGYTPEGRVTVLFQKKIIKTRCEVNGIVFHNIKREVANPCPRRHNYSLIIMIIILYNESCSEFYHSAPDYNHCFIQYLAITSVIKIPCRVRIFF